jgi:hypothetical protein
MDPALPDCSQLTTRRYVQTGNWADRDLLIGQMGSSGALAGAAVIGPLNQHPIPCGLQTLHKASPDTLNLHFKENQIMEQVEGR